jgi:hypothetical protein
MLRKYILYFILLFSSSVFTAEPKPKLHVLIMCDTVSSNIKKATFVDLENMKRISSLIAEKLNMKKKITVLKGKAMNPAPLDHWIKSVSISPNDVVIFYYTGHGVRQESDLTPWPSFVIPNHLKSRLTLVPGEKIREQIKTHNPRFALVLFDCCNFDVSAKKILLSPKSPMFRCSSASLPGLCSLFKRSHGIVTIAASSPGEFAIAITGGKNKGSLFTSQFVNSLLQKCHKKDVTWNQVLKQTMYKCAELSDKTQTPVGNIEIQ